MNQPDRYSRFVLPSGVDAAVEYKPDTKMRAAGQFSVWLEDHTVGNLVRQQLLTNPEVRRCGWCLWWRCWGLAVVCTLGSIFCML
jgi:DNA-directed RNA polymerase II subunit RPB11